MSRRIAIITDDPGWHGARLREAFARRDCHSEFVSLKQCGFDLSGDGPGLVIPGFDALPDGVFVRGVPGGSLEQVVFYLDLLHALRRLGVYVYNNAGAIERSVDKGMTSFLLHSAGIATPPSWVLSENADLSQLLERELGAGHELVYKPLFGSQGEGLLRIRQAGDLPVLEACNGVYYLQRFIPTAAEKTHDWRVFVINGQAVAAMRRYSRDWICNVAQGGDCRPAVLDAPLRKLAEAAVAELEMDYAGVDIMRDRKGAPYVIEVNSIPAWKGLQQVCSVDITSLLVDDFLRCCQNAPLMEVV